MSGKQRLELTWIGKENRPRLEPRILLEDAEKTYHAKHRVTDNDIFDNRLIFGDNLLALKALEQEFAARIRCVFIDPPYNTSSAFVHYDDGIEHSIWLSLMRDRLELLRRLMADDGSIWITIDDNEAHYLKVLCDEIFGRQNFIGNAIWEKSDSPRMDATLFSNRHDHLLVFAKDVSRTIWNRLLLNEVPAHYNRTDEQGRIYYTKPLRAMGGQGETRAARPKLYYGLVAPDGSEIFPKLQDGTDGAWRWSREKVADEKERIVWVNGRSGWTPYFKIYAPEAQTMPVETIWPHTEVGSNRTSKAEAKALLPDEITFGTPKPEALLKRIISIATNPGDLTFDSFAGSGTTGAVAHKMGRKWIMVEVGEHAFTHILPRMKKVIDGKDPGGVTEATGWSGGGGFRYFHIAPSLLEKDRFGNLIISKQYNGAMLAEAMCKIMGFTYAPSDELYWQQGYSTENDFIYVTTQTLTREQLEKLSDEVGEHRSLLICCAAFRGKADAFPSLTVKKIPSAVLAKCEWGHDDYSLNVANLPKAAPPPDPVPADTTQPLTPKQARRRAAQPSLFAADGNGGAG
jgi:adenine-specific DNA-methyltransferase